MVMVLICVKLLKKNSETKVFILTAKDEEEDILKGLLLGDEYLTNHLGSMS